MQNVMSALPPESGHVQRTSNVRFVPKADIGFASDQPYLLI
jgi:hypothetical protein